ncbi:MAG: VCBS repeat-containing protein [Acidobacteriales bacterium]|nr:VCBS repeat-containing protein [Terriglobales bacterium]
MWSRRRLLELIIAAGLLPLPTSQASRLKITGLLTVDTDPNQVAVADFNRDGKLDLAVASGDSNSTVSVLLGNGDGTFQTQVRYPVGNFPYGVTAADVNLDGSPDLLVGNYEDGTMSVLLGNGDGTFQTQLAFVTGGGPETIVVGDFNGDGLPDVFAASYEGALLLGNGDGTFQAASLFLPSTRPLSAAVGDYNCDGQQDLAITFTSGIFNQGIVEVLLGNGDGTFRIGDSYSLMVSTPYSIAVADLNHDGRLDLAVTTFELAAAVLLGHGDGTFTSAVYYTTPYAAYGIAIADFNRDGNPDLAVANFILPSYLSVFAGNRDGTFQPAVNYKMPEGSNYADAVAAGDFNGDGSTDVVLANATSANLSVLLNTGGTLMRTASSLNPSRVGQSVTFTTQVKASLSGTGTPTGTVTFKDGSKSIKVSLISGTAKFTTSRLTQGTHQIQASYAGDANFNPNSAKPLVQVVNPGQGDKVAERGK